MKTRLVFIIPRVVGVVGFATVIGGCTPNHMAFEKAVRQRVSVGMTLSTAVSSLAKMHVDCYGGYQVSCTRDRSGPMLSAALNESICTSRKTILSSIQLRFRRSLAHGCKGKLSEFDARKRPVASGGFGSRSVASG
jgi:hypothetical protein